jgi:hypothetical protein
MKAISVEKRKLIIEAKQRGEKEGVCVATVTSFGNFLSYGMVKNQNYMITCTDRFVLKNMHIYTSFDR